MFVALAALFLGIFNYRQAKRRDSYHLTAIILNQEVKGADGITEADLVECEIVNTGQRPVTIKNIGLVFGPNRHFPILTMKRRWRCKWHERLTLQGLTFVENRPQTVHFRWGPIEDFLIEAGLTNHPRFEGAQLNLGGGRFEFLDLPHKDRITKEARSILLGKLAVVRPTKSSS